MQPRDGWTRYAVVPVPKPRQTQKDKWAKRPCVLRYRAFADRCRELGMVVTNGCSVVFHMPMPRSWGGEKKLTHRGKPHKAKPDLDNLLKAVMDATCPGDQCIWELLTVRKVWADEGAVWVKRPMLRFTEGSGVDFHD